MFRWGRKKSQDDLSPEVKQIFEKIGRLFESEALQNSLLPEPLKAVVLNGQNCDKIPGGRGEFGRDPTNPIPANGPIGQILYLSQLRTARSNSPIMFHRVSSTRVGNADVDMYEVLSIDESMREYLYLSLYHPRKSRLCPEGYKVDRKVDFGNPIYGVNFLVRNFPRELDLRIREWQMRTLGFPFSMNEVRKYLNGSVLPSMGDPNGIAWNSRKREQSEGFGLCFNCWTVKQHFIMGCEQCGRRPTTPDEAIYSIALSSIYYDPPTLSRISEQLKYGQKTASLTLEQMDALRPAAIALLQHVNPIFDEDEQR